MLHKAVSHLKSLQPVTRLRPRSLAAMAAAKPTIKVDVVSDVVCPWCYVGKRRLEKAMQQFEGKAQFDVHWLPFQLNPAAGPEAINKLQYYNDKFGPARTAQIIPNMQQTFASEGLQYSIGGETGNTRRAHRLMAWAAKEHGLAKQDALAELLFEGYHCKEQYVNGPEILLSAAEAAALPRDAAAAALEESGPGEALVQQELGTYAGVTGVPHFVVNGRHHVGGAQSPEVLAELFQELLQQQPAVA
eukprot:GHRQ01002848.1.p1 GENE.GHRQ01002848.1~~GHRQ01002848.1.p1  ORF type:complete len:246 (+),score=76.26 GHRQ01002848.1:159-896(+)